MTQSQKYPPVETPAHNLNISFSPLFWKWVYSGVELACNMYLFTLGVLIMPAFRFKPCENTSGLQYLVLPQKHPRYIGTWTFLQKCPEMCFIQSLAACFALLKEPQLQHYSCQWRNTQMDPQAITGIIMAYADEKHGAGHWDQLQISQLNCPSSKNMAYNIL